MTNSKLTVVPKFRDLCRKLSAKEHAQLEANILKAKRIHEPIVTWKDQIIDGHNRYAIATKHGINFTTRLMVFANEHEAMDWIIHNQLGRRNLNAKEASYLRGKLYNSKKSKNPEKTPLYQFDTTGNTRVEIATESGVSPATVSRDAAFAKDVDRLAKPIADAVRSGDLKATKEEVAMLAKHGKRDQKEIVRRVENGEAKSIKHAIECAAQSTEDDEPETWQVNAEIHKLACNDLNRIIRQVKAICSKPSGKYLAHAATRIVKACQDAKTPLFQLMPVSADKTRQDEQRSKK